MLILFKIEPTELLNISMGPRKKDVAGQSQLPSRVEKE